MTVQVTIAPNRHVTLAGSLRGPGSVVDVTEPEAATLIAEEYAVAGAVDITEPARTRTPEPPLPEGGERLRKLPGVQPRRRKSKPTGEAA